MGKPKMHQKVAGKQSLIILMGKRSLWKKPTKPEGKLNGKHVKHPQNMGNKVLFISNKMPPQPTTTLLACCTNKHFSPAMKMSTLTVCELDVLQVIAGCPWQEKNWTEPNWQKKVEKTRHLATEKKLWKEEIQNM